LFLVLFFIAAVEFLVLEDLAHGFEKPCVLDVKIGKRTWGPDATIEKINHEKVRSEIYQITLSTCKFF